MKPASIKPVRCAIYTGVSTEHGLDQEYHNIPKGASRCKTRHVDNPEKALAATSAENES